MPPLNIAFWNLQNLFDTTASEIAADLDFTPENGWDEAALEAKLDALASVVNLMHNGEGPDLLGIAEVETNELTLELINRLNRDDLAFVQADSPDLRGIDTGLIYSMEKFALEDAQSHMVHLRFRTRDILEVDLRVKENNAPLHVLVNHWPSRRRGVHESEPFRIAVGAHCGRIVDRLLKFPRQQFLALPDTAVAMQTLQERWNGNVLVKGDLNDEPFDRSVLDALRAANSQDRLEEELKPGSGREIPSAESYLRIEAYLYNYMWQFAGRDDVGTLFFSGDGTARTKQLLDQFIASRGLHYGLSSLQLNSSSVSIFSPQIMITRSNEDPANLSADDIRPKPFDKQSHRGVSDHFPITAEIEVQ